MCRGKCNSPFEERVLLPTGGFRSTQGKAPPSPAVQTDRTAGRTKKRQVARKGSEEAEVGVVPRPVRPVARTEELGSAARLPHFLARWSQVTDSQFILNIVANGYMIQFESEPYQEFFAPFELSDEDVIICKRKVEQFLLSGAIVRVQPCQGQFLSNIFPVIKKSLMDHRIIIDLSSLNEFVRKCVFKLDSLNMIMSMIRPQDFFVSIDISDAYYAVALHEVSMPYVTFVFMNALYQFACLPQGLSSAPRIFTKILRVVMMFLRSSGIRIAAWFDDLLLAASSASLCADQAHTALGTLTELGFLPNYEKSSLTPVQQISHLGLMWDSVSFTVAVLEPKLLDVQEKCRVALRSPVRLRHLASILGSIEYFRWGFPFAAVHYRGLQRFVNAKLAAGLSYSSKVTASDEARSDLTWWVDAGSSLPPRSLAPFCADLTLYTDASLLGWGGWVCDGREAFGGWSDDELLDHINVLELRAVLFLFRCFFSRTFDCSICIYSDSTSVVAYINHQGGTASRELCDLSLELWLFCIRRRIFINAAHLGGVYNCRADFLSRLAISDHSYSLNQCVFDDVCSLLDFPLTIDCFASRLNFKISTFISRYNDPDATLVDAFSVPWRDFLYLFPPYPVLDRVLAKFMYDAVGHGLLVCPYWPSQPWYATLLDLLIGEPILLPASAVDDPDGRLPRNTLLLACPISSRQQLQRGFRRGLPDVACGVSRGTLLSHTRCTGGSSMIGFIGGKGVTMRLL